jgi:hypothetical protein
VRTTLTLDDDVLAVARETARLEGKTIGEVVSEFSREGMNRRRVVSSSSVRRFPSFEVAVDAPAITTAMVLEALADE